ncbi:MAG: type II/IV secretion system ATPase subunit, partial [Thermoplasmatales archaeon]|nr:type II/IV secretion system ATPase subunit [Thermoplasmatales archaeon]
QIAKKGLDVELTMKIREQRKTKKEEKKAKKIEAKKALIHVREEEWAAKKAAKLETEKEKQKLKKLELKKTTMEAKEEERAAKKAEKEEEQKGINGEMKEKECISPEGDIDQLGFYPVNEPFAYVKILKDTKSLDKYYKVIQPYLSEQEDEIFNFIQEKLIKSMDMRLDELDPDHAESFLVEYLDQIMKDHELKIDGVLKKKMIYCIKREFLGYGKIDPLMRDPNIEDISCDGSDVPIFLYHRKYGSLKSNIKFGEEEELAAFVINLAQKCGKHISLAEPMLDATMPDGSRIQMTLSKTVTTKGSTFTIRKFRSNPITPTDLIEYNTMSLEMVAYMWMAVENGINALIAGSTAAGKTSTLNALSLFIPREAKIVSIEETREVNLPHPNWIPGVVRSGFGEIINDKLVGEIDLFDLMKAALRQRPEYILVGE